MRATRRGQTALAWTISLGLIIAPGMAEMLGSAITSTPAGPGVSGEVTPDRQAKLTVRVAEAPTVKASRSRRAVDSGTLLDWHALALCESSDNPRAVSSSGKYRGLYQFDRATWLSVGGVGDPAQASRTEQTRRAQLLYARRGAQPWPVCGRWLRVQEVQ